ncbi:hypothetical protein [Oceanobacillus salinisoli]|uniref:hypothetical protein n=1 Tax=Oceanobacillus salinisoli TaxID=2678611 RepID=UPI0012E13D52|nr:hypothetical protein [Oceanobacillus salinisoli]
MKRSFKMKVFILILTTILIGCTQKQDSTEQVPQNKNILNFTDFSVSSDSTELETSVIGTVFLVGKDGVPEHVQIVAMVEIDPDDWGGVAFQIPKQLDISSIRSSYPEDENDERAKDYVSVWTNEEEEQNKMIEIGTNRYHPTGSGKGTIVIEMDINKETISKSDVFNISVGVGSEEKNGVRSIRPDYEVVEIPMKK